MKDCELPYILMSVFIPLVLIGFVLITMLFRRLKSAHRTRYEELGSPTFLSPYNFSSQIKVSKFILLREHKDLGDKFLSRLSDAILAYSTTYIILFTLVIIGGRYLPFESCKPNNQAERTSEPPKVEVILD